MLPLLPEMLDPELKYNAPLEPLVPAFKLRITMLPLVEDVPSPDEMRTDPPVLPVEALLLRPAFT